MSKEPLLTSKSGTGGSLQAQADTDAFEWRWNNSDQYFASDGWFTNTVFGEHGVFEKRQQMAAPNVQKQHRCACIRAWMFWYVLPYKSTADIFFEMFDLMDDIAQFDRQSGSQLRANIHRLATPRAQWAQCYRLLVARPGRHRAKVVFWWLMFARVSFWVYYQQRRDSGFTHTHIHTHTHNHTHTPTPTHTHTHTHKHTHTHQTHTLAHTHMCVRAQTQTHIYAFMCVYMMQWRRRWRWAGLDLYSPLVNNSTQRYIHIHVHTHTHNARTSHAHITHTLHHHTATQKGV